MVKVLVIYYSETGNTREMAELVAEGVKEAGVEVEVKRVKDAKVDELLKVDGVVIGSPTYYGCMAAEVKRFLDESVKLHGRLEGKVGGAFTSSANIGGGNETTIISILQAFLIHGMVVQGMAFGDHYGPVAVGRPDERSRKLCLKYGRRIGELAKKLAGK